jgi:serine protease AprX
MVSRMIITASLLVWSQFGLAGQVLKFQRGEVPTIDKEILGALRLEASRSQPVPTRLYVMQFKQIIRDQDRNMLQDSGLKIYNYIPDDAYVVEGSPDTVLALSLRPEIQAVLPMMPIWKKSADLPRVSVFNRNNQAIVMVQLNQDSQEQEFRDHLKGLDGAEILDGEGNAYYLKVELSQIDQLARMDEVIWIQAFSQMRLQYMNFPENSSYAGFEINPQAGDYTDLTGFESGTKIMGFEEAWKRGFDGRGQQVAMADTGLDSGDIPSVVGEFQGQVKKGYSYGIGASNWSDVMGHGTHVAGSVMSNGATSGGRIRGGAFAAEMIPEGMWSPIINNLTVPAKLNKLFASVYSDGARIHTNSWGGGQIAGAYDSYASQADEFIWANPDMLVLFAAGNNGVDRSKDGRVDENSMASPGSAKNVLTIGASENLIAQGGIQRKLGELMGGEPWGVEPLKSDTLSNSADGMAAFSSRGPCLDGRIKPDVVAPGTNVVSTCSTVKGASPLWGNYNPSYCYSGGTSMSTPLVAGAAAVLRQYLSQEWGNPTPSAALMKGILIATADDMYPGQYGIGPSQELPKSAPNNHEGYGRVNIERATTPKILESYYSLIDQTQGLGTGEIFTEKVKVSAGKVKVTLVYTDAPGAPNAAKALVNNLDLEVEIAPPSGVGQTPPLGEGSLPTTLVSKNSTDNIEQLILDQAAAGELTIRVVGTNIPKGRNGKQPFAVVVSK